MKSINLFFWQPQTDILRWLNHRIWGRVSIIILNYLIWFYLFYVSVKLISFNTNIFWQLLIATVVGETVERYGKSHALWRRPMFTRHDATPPGLVKKWYQTGSFPSGHTMKAIFFFLFILQYGQINPTQFAVLCSGLLFFRVLVGFHYPIDIVGGGVIGALLWILTHQLIFPAFLNTYIRVIFNFVFGNFLK
jgi:membrane-associated phospholipid phosphatase